MDEGCAGGWPPGAGAGTVIPGAGGRSSGSKEDIEVLEEPDSQLSTLSRPGFSTQIGDSRELEPKPVGTEALVLAANFPECAKQDKPGRDPTTEHQSCIRPSETTVFRRGIQPNEQFREGSLLVSCGAYLGSGTAPSPPVRREQDAGLCPPKVCTPASPA
uniref:Uncharacterized protein n=1 Tax=Rangifer tarandus platyrhynchus TaxID=3082113 RepID=A0ACB0DVW8_RANTA|nr:unnamed protein product [Rangifer tarandus platyrhynchus]